MDTVYRTAKTEGPEAALKVLEDRDEGYYDRHYKKLEPDFEKLHQRYLQNNPRVYSPYKREDFNWTEEMILFERCVKAWRAGVCNLPSFVFLGPSNTGKSAWLRYVFREELRSGKALVISTLEGLERFRTGKTTLIFMEDPAFDRRGTLGLSTGVLEALLSTDQQRDIRVLYKIISKPPNVPVIIVGNPENLPVELGGNKDITGVLGEAKKKGGGYAESMDPAEIAEANSRVSRSNIDIIRAQKRRTGKAVPTWDRDIPKSVIKRRLIFWITDNLLKKESVERYARQADALMNPLEHDESRRYDLSYHVKRLPELKNYLHTHGGWEEPEESISDEEWAAQQGFENSEPWGDFDFIEK